MDLDPQQLGFYVRTRRDELELSQQELAERAQVPQSQVSKLERGQITDPSFYLVMAIAAALDLSPHQLMTGSAAPRARVKQLQPHLGALQPKQGPSPELIDAAQRLMDLLQPQEPAAREGIQLGNIFARDEIVTISDHDLGEHLLITGTTGTGKSVLMQHLVSQSMQSGSRAIVVDGHGNLVDELLRQHISEGRDLEDIVLVDLTNPVEHEPQLNVLDVTDSNDVRQAADSAVQLVRHQLLLNESALPRALNYVLLAALALAEANVLIDADAPRFCVSDIAAFYLDEELRQRVVHMSSNMSVREAFDPERGRFEMLAERSRHQHIGPLLSAVQMLTGRVNAMAMHSWISSGKHVLIKCSPLVREPHLGAMQLMVRLLVDQAVHTHALQYALDPTTPALRVFCEEAPWLLESGSKLVDWMPRRTNYGLVVSTHHLEQLEEQARKRLMLSCANHISFATSMAEASERAEVIDAAHHVLDERDVIGLPNYHAYANLKIAGEHTGPFAFKVLDPPKLRSDRNLVTASVKEFEQRMRDALTSKPLDDAQYAELLIELKSNLR